MCGNSETSTAMNPIRCGLHHIFSAQEFPFFFHADSRFPEQTVWTYEDELHHKFIFLSCLMDLAHAPLHPKERSQRRGGCGGLCGGDGFEQCQYGTLVNQAEVG